MKIGVFTRYSSLGASSRLRFLQYFPELEKHGFTVCHEPLFTNEYINLTVSGGSKAKIVVQSLKRRIRSLYGSNHLDIIWMEKDALPWIPAFLELKIFPRCIPILLDYDDAVFHQYDTHQNWVVRRLLGSKHRALMHKASLVVAGNQYIAEYAWHAGARRVEILPTVVDLVRYPNLTDRTRAVDNAMPTIGWIGQNSTAVYLKRLSPLFKQLGDEGLAQFRAIGVNSAVLDPPMTSEVWSEATEVASIQQLDIGVMPLEDGPFERGKCGYKLIQYMACGLPVVASPVGVNSMIVQHGINGFLASSINEWEHALRVLASSPALRQRMGSAGRTKVEREYCLESTSPRLVRWLSEVASRHT